MSSGIDRPAAEALVDELCKAPENISDFLKASEIIQLQHEPVKTLLAINVMIARLEKNPMCDCGKATCISAPQHLNILGPFLAESMPLLEETRDKYREQVVDWVVKTLNCNCKACETLHKEIAAPLN